MEIAQKVQSLYAVRYLDNQRPQQPSLRVIPSLFELSLASLMPQFLLQYCEQQEFSNELYAELLGLLPDDCALQDVIKIENDDFWCVRCKRHFGFDGRDRADYLRAKFSDLLAGRNAGFEVYSLRQFVQACGAFVLRLDLCVVPGYFDFELLQGMPNIQELNVQCAQSQAGSSPGFTDAAAAPVTGSVIRGKSLGEIARQNCIQNDEFMAFLYSHDKSPQLETYTQELSQRYQRVPSAFPFHTVASCAGLQTTGATATHVFESTIEAAVLTRGDCAKLANYLRQMQFLQTFRITKAQLSSELSDLIAGALRQLNLDCIDNAMQCMDLSFNDLGDAALKLVMKLAIRFPGYHKTEVKDLVLRSCRFTGYGASMIGAALGSPGCELEALDISGNAIGIDGFVLVCNGVLKAFAKHGNTCFKRLRARCCAINFADEHIAVIERMAAAGVELMDFSGNACTTQDVAQRLKATQGVVFAAEEQ